ncbi:amidase signature domain-containing protein [Trichoderma chlorosporum]
MTASSSSLSPHLATMSLSDGWQSVIRLDERSYQWSQDPVARLSDDFRQLCSEISGSPCLVFRADDCPDFVDSSLCELFSHWLTIDDVTSVSFCRAVFLLDPSLESGTAENMSKDSFPGLRDLGTINVIRMATNGLQGLRSGPYFYQEASFHHVYRAFPDSQSAFFSAITQSPISGQFIEHRPTDHIAVPSRLYSPPQTAKLPLSGLRFASKDVFDVAGLKTSAGSRSFFELSDPKPKSAFIVQKLTALGAVLVGKAKNTQFANGEDPQEWIDYRCPWNPRGDGYQNPDTSSSGSATAVSSYSCLDFAIGSDTCGSIACPAAAQGIFGLRLSTGALSHEGAFTVSKYLDTSGIFTRSIDILHLVTSKLLEGTSEYGRSPPLSEAQTIPSRIVYPKSSFPHDNGETIESVDRFIKALESFCDTERTTLDIDEEWKKTDPQGLGLSIYSELKMTTAHLHLAGFYDAITPFQKAYRNIYQKNPYLDRVNTEKLKLARLVTIEDREKMVQQKAFFANFAYKQILQSGDGSGAAGSLGGIMVWPFNPQEPQYRDSYPPLTPHVNWRWDVDYTAPLAGLPQVIVPIGQFRYESRITGEPDFLPIAASIVGPPGSDIALLDFVSKFLQRTRGLLSVKPGRYIV